MSSHKCSFHLDTSWRWLCAGRWARALAKGQGFAALLQSDLPSPVTVAQCRAAGAFSNTFCLLQPERVRRTVWGAALGLRSAAAAVLELLPLLFFASRSWSRIWVLLACLTVRKNNHTFVAAGHAGQLHAAGVRKGMLLSCRSSSEWQQQCWSTGLAYFLIWTCILSFRCSMMFVLYPTITWLSASSVKILNFDGSGKCMTSKNTSPCEWNERYDILAVGNACLRLVLFPDFILAPKII